MKTGEKAAREAVAQFLKEAALPVMLFRVSVVADHAAYVAKRKSELFASLFDYERLLPKGYKCFWRNNGAGSVYVVGNRGETSQPPMPGVFDAGVDMG